MCVCSVCVQWKRITIPHTYVLTHLIKPSNQHLKCGHLVSILHKVAASTYIRDQNMLTTMAVQSLKHLSYCENFGLVDIK